MGYTVNLALPENYTDAGRQSGVGGVAQDACLWRACDDLLVPAMRRFQPDLVLLSAGFDAVKGDPLGGAACTVDGFGRLAQRVKQLAEQFCQGRLLLSLEGGYDEGALGACVGTVAKRLLEGSLESLGPEAVALGAEAAQGRAADGLAARPAGDAPRSPAAALAARWCPAALRPCAQLLGAVARGEKAALRDSLPRDEALRASKGDNLLAFQG